MEKFNRAVRRHHVARLKVKRKSYWGYHRHYGAETREVISPKTLGRVVQNPAVCSSYCCGNPRHFPKGGASWASRTMQERGFFQRLLHREE